MQIDIDDNDLKGFNSQAKDELVKAPRCAYGTYTFHYVCCDPIAATKDFALSSRLTNIS